MEMELFEEELEEKLLDNLLEEQLTLLELSDKWL